MTKDFKSQKRFVHLVKTIGRNFFLPRESVLAGNYNYEIWGDCLAIPVDFLLYTTLPANAYSCYHLLLRSNDSNNAELIEDGLVFDLQRSLNDPGHCKWFTFTHPILDYTVTYKADPKKTIRYSGDYHHDDFAFPFLALREVANTSEDDPILDDMGPTICSLHKDSYRLKHEYNT